MLYLVLIAQTLKTVLLKVVHVTQEPAVATFAKALMIFLMIYMFLAGAIPPIVHSYQNPLIMPSSKPRETSHCTSVNTSQMLPERYLVFSALQLRRSYYWFDQWWPCAKLIQGAKSLAGCWKSRRTDRNRRKIR